MFWVRGVFGHVSGRVRAGSVPEGSGAVINTAHVVLGRTCTGRAHGVRFVSIHSSSGCLVQQPISIASSSTWLQRIKSACAHIVKRHATRSSGAHGQGTELVDHGASRITTVHPKKGVHIVCHPPAQLLPLKPGLSSSVRVLGLKTAV